MRGRDDSIFFSLISQASTSNAAQDVHSAAPACDFRFLLVYRRRNEYDETKFDIQMSLHLMPSVWRNNAIYEGNINHFLLIDPVNVDWQWMILDSFGTTWSSVFLSAPYECCLYIVHFATSLNAECNIFHIRHQNRFFLCLAKCNLICAESEYKYVCVPAVSEEASLQSPYARVNILCIFS